MKFARYQHIERLGTSETEGIEFGICHVFPKIDGTNGSVWVDGDKMLQFGSRKRVITLDADNAGFCRDMIGDKNLNAFFAEHPNLRLFGEWLVPHSLKTYRDEAWRKFYVFDVTMDLDEELPSGEKFHYLSYEDYYPLMERFGINYIPCLAKVMNGDFDFFIEQLNSNDFLIVDGKGVGEGIVIKNYNYTNKYGRKTWAKIVTSEFKEKHVKAMGPPDKAGTYGAEQRIVDKYCTDALIEKTFSKICVANEGWSSSLIGQLLGRVYHDLVTEECWNFIKEFAKPSIDFKRLQGFVVVKVKEVKSELF